jgi:hypothetical protein
VTGIYFIANDKTYDLVIAFLNSVRVFEPLLPLCLIPYDSDCDRVADLASAYNFSVWTDDDILRRCDKVSRYFHLNTIGQYRKLAVWEGPFDEFAYIDIDTVLLSRLEFGLRLLKSYDFVTGISNIESIRKFVWKGNVNELMPDLDTEYAANTGFILSKKGALTLSNAERKAQEVVHIKSHMALECTEQPFLNYLIVTSGGRYSSLSHIRSEESRHDLPVEIWGGMFDDDILRLNVPVQLIHWAGKWQDGSHIKSHTWRHFRYLRDGY